MSLPMKKNSLLHWIACLRFCLVFVVLVGTGNAKPARSEGVRTVHLPILSKNFYPGPGTVTGKVINSSTGTPVGSQSSPAALVCFDGTLCDYTDAEGYYSISGIPAGPQVLTASGDGFHSSKQTAWVLGYHTASLNFALTPYITGESIVLRIILTWDDTKNWINPSPPFDSRPNDLDAHLWLDATTPAHIYSGERGDCTIYPNACLEVDYQYGFGPETIAVRKTENGNYFFGVLNYYQGYPGVPPISRTAAQVEIFDENGLVQAFQVPSSGDGDFWYVFSMVPAGEDKVLITPTNCITNYGSGTLPSCP